MKKLLTVILLMVVVCACSSRRSATTYNWNDDYHQRLLTDFCLNESQVKQYIQRYIPNVSEGQMHTWEKEKALEYMIIDGKKRYFKNAAPNLFRIDPECKQIKMEKDNNHSSLQGSEIDDYENIPSIIEDVEKGQGNIVEPKHVKVTYTLTVNPNAVPNGKMIRCWLPYPRTDIARQRDVRLISTSEQEFVISPDRKSVV